MKRLVLVTIFLSVLGLVGCKVKEEQGSTQIMEQEMHQEMNHPSEEAEISPEGVAVRQVTADEIGKNALCPVTKNKFNVTEDTLAAEYRTETYYFCCPGCDEEFTKDPEKYIK